MISASMAPFALVLPENHVKQTEKSQAIDEEYQPERRRYRRYVRANTRSN